MLSFLNRPYTVHAYFKSYFFPKLTTVFPHLRFMTGENRFMTGENRFMTGENRFRTSENWFILVKTGLIDRSLAILPAFLPFLLLSS